MTDIELGDVALRVLLDRGGFDAWWDEIDQGTREDIARQIASSISAALSEAGWGPTAARPDQDSGLTVPSPVGVLPRDRSGASLIAAERQRQIDAEGWTPEHDDGYVRRELLAAARCYTTAGTPEGATEQRRGIHVPWGWPLTWDPTWWKPEGHCRDSWEGTGPSVRDLTKAGALIAAEIDRLSRR